MDLDYRYQLRNDDAKADAFLRDHTQWVEAVRQRAFAADDPHWSIAYALISLETLLANRLEDVVRDLFELRHHDEEE